MTNYLGFDLPLDGIHDGVNRHIVPPDQPVQMIALEMRVGRIEEAAADLDELAAAFEQPGRTGSDPQMVAHLRRVLRYLSFQKNVLIGNYPDAGTDLEDVEGPLVGLGGLQEEVKRRGFDPRPFAALGAGWPVVTMLGAQSPLGVVALFWGGEMQARNFQGIRGTINRKMQADADFFFRRGFLALLEGDIPAARGRFQETTRPPPPGWNLPTVRHAMAGEYLRLIDAAEKKAGP